MREMDIYRMVIEKIKVQWKTLKKAFIDLNQDKSGAIAQSELKHYLTHWGLELTPIQFQTLFRRFDEDGDGKISYKDFQTTIGMEIAPAESLYFRQDKSRVSKIISCKQGNCWTNCLGQSEYCQVHIKMFKEKGTQICNDLPLRVKRWPAFMYKLKKYAEKSDSNLI